MTSPRLELRDSVRLSGGSTGHGVDMGLILGIVGLSHCDTSLQWLSLHSIRAAGLHVCAFHAVYFYNPKKLINEPLNECICNDQLNYQLNWACLNVDRAPKAWTFKCQLCSTGARKES